MGHETHGLVGTVAGNRKDGLADGLYDCAATVHVKDGRVAVVLHTTFDLPPGTSIPLLRKECDMRVEELSGSQVGLFNGHAII